MIVTFATENYSDYLLMLLDSYFYFNRNKKAKVYLIEWTKKSFSNISKQYPDVSFEDVKAGDVVRKKASKNKRSGEVLKIKPELIYNFYKETNEPFLWVDADSLILNDISPLLEKLSDKSIDLMCTHRPNHHLDHAKFAVAVLGFGNHKNGRKFLEEYVSSTRKCEGVKNWFHEQLSLYIAFSKSSPKLYPLKESEHSIRKNENTIVFSRRIGFEYEKMKDLLIKKGVYSLGKLHKL